jgi:starch phosphorylase
MKAAANGALNLSTLDGWWSEACGHSTAQIGWPVGKGEVYADADYQDQVEAAALYDSSSAT